MRICREDLTFLSKSLSHMSLMVQPAPLINNEPVPNNASMLKSGRQPGSAASPILHVQGKKSNHVPVDHEKQPVTVPFISVLIQNAFQTPFCNI